MFCTGIWPIFSTTVHSLLLLSAVLGVPGWEETENIHYTNSWAVHLENGDTEVANRIAKRHGFINLGQVGSLPGYYHFVHEPVKNRRKRREIDKTELLLTEKEVKWVEQQQVLERDKRSTVIPEFVEIDHPGSVTIQDPLFKDQWYLSNIGQSSGPPNLDINILPVWAKGITGRGVVVAILDDGLDYTHPDLIKNYDSKASYDFNDYDNDPMPRIADPNNCHGTKCAGQVAAESGNGICGVGVAFNSSIGGIRMLDGNTTDTIEGSSLSFRNNYIHIYSCAWGPKDDGKRFGRPGTLASKALELGTKEGRGGLGSIFVWATGNGGLTDDDCNCDGYTTSIHTISIGAISDHGLSTYYTESCASTLAVTYSGGSHREKRENKIITTTLNHKCTDKFKGTSSAAPLAAGMIALMLESNPKLTWRDVQAVIVETALMTSPLDEGWRRNGAGKWFNQKFGFGRMDASQLIEKAKNWDNISEQKKCWATKNVGPWKIPESGTVLVSANSTACSSTKSEVRNLEHVQLVITLKHRHRGHLSIELISPAGTRSQILKTRRNDHSNKGLKDWIFMSVHFWGEDPRGTWTLAVTDNNNNNRRHYRMKMKHGDLEDATEALQDELMGKPRPDDEELDSSSQEHEGVLDKNKDKIDSKLSEDFEGGVFEDETYRNTQKERQREEAERRKNGRKKGGKGKGKGKKKKKRGKHHHHHHHHRYHKHHRSHKKDRPTVAVKEFTRTPTLFGKTFEDITKQGQAVTFKSTEKPNFMPQQSYSTSRPFKMNTGTNQTGSSQNWNQSSFKPVNSQGYESPIMLGQSSDQTLNPTTRQNFGRQETTPSVSQHDMIQNLVKSVLSEMFLALRSQRNESRNEGGLGQTLSAVMEGSTPAKTSQKPVENFSSSLSKAWRKEKGVQKINTLLGILDKVKNISNRVNSSDAENNTRGDEMVSDVLKVLRDILSASKGNEKMKDFKARVSKLVEDSSNETRNLTQKLFDDLEPGADANRTGIVINDALSLISAIFEGDSQKKKNSSTPDATTTGPPEPFGIVLRRQDGSFIIPNTMTTGIQMQPAPENIVKSWSNASQIETVRIEHTKVSPVNIVDLGANEMKNKTEGLNDVDMTTEVKGKEQGGKKDAWRAEDDDKIDFQVERSGDGKESNFETGEDENLSLKNHGHESPEDESILNMRALKKSGNKEMKNGGYVFGKKYHNFGTLIEHDKSRGEGNRDYSRFSMDNGEFMENQENLKSDSINRNLDAANHNFDSTKESPGSPTDNPDASKRNPDSDSRPENKDDQQIDVTVVFDDDKKNTEFMKEVNKEEMAKREKEKSPGLDLEEFTVQKPTPFPPQKSSNPKTNHQHKIHNSRFPVMQAFQPAEFPVGRNDQNDDDDNSRSKGEIPENEADDDENEQSSTSLYDVRDMQNPLPFYPVPVPDQRGYGLLTQMLGPFQDAAFSQGIDVLNAIEQEPLLEDNRDFYEPNYRREWKRSLPETFQPTTKVLSPTEGSVHRAKSRKRRSSQDGHISSNSGLNQGNVLQSNSPAKSAVKSSLFSKRSVDIASARKRFADLVDMVHRNPSDGLSLFNVRNMRFGRSSTQKDYPGTSNRLLKQSVEKPLGSILPNINESADMKIQNKTSLGGTKLQNDVRVASTAQHRRRRSVEEIGGSILKQSDTIPAPVVRHRNRRSAEAPFSNSRSFTDHVKYHSDVTRSDAAKIVNQRSVGSQLSTAIETDQSPSLSPSSDKRRFSPTSTKNRPDDPGSTFNKIIYRDKRDKIIDDYEEGDNDDDNGENEPHVVKRSAIFSELMPSKHSKRADDNDYDDDGDSRSDNARKSSDNVRQLRSKRDSEDDYDDDSDEQSGDARSSVAQLKVSSLEGALRKKLLSMRTQSKSVMKLLQRVHHDISLGDTNDLRDLENKISIFEHNHAAKQTKKSNPSPKQHRRSKYKVKTKSATPKPKPRPKKSDDNNNDNNEDNDTEKQEKLAYKQDPDAYLKYGAGNTGGLESWTLIFYGT